MRSTFLQNQSRLGHRLVDCGSVGISSIFGALNKVLLPSQSVHIGLSGLLIWVATTGVCAADPTPNSGQSSRVLDTRSIGQPGAIKDPMHPQGYLLELAEKMGDSGPGKAVLGGKNLQKPRRVASTPAPSQPALKDVTWLSPSSKTPHQSVTSQPVMSQPTWLSSGRQMVSKTTSPESIVDQARWLSPSTPGVRMLTPAQAAPHKAAEPAPPMNHATWLPASNPPVRTPAPANPAAPMSHATWLPAGKPAAPTSAPPQPAWPAPEKHFAQKPATPAPAQNPTTWLSRENGAAQQALNKMAALRARSQQANPSFHEPTMAHPTPTAVANSTPQRKPRQPAMPGHISAPQMPLSHQAGAGVEAARPVFSPVMYAAMDMSQAKHFFADPSEPAWSLGADLDKYRAHAVKEGARHSGQSLQKALENIGLIVEDSTNVITLGYASDRAAIFRENDGKGLIDDPGRVPKQAGETVVSLGDGLYSIADLVTLNALPDHEKAVYQDNHPLVRPLVFTGRTIGGAWKTTEEIGNAVTWGYFDNFTGSIGMCIEDLLEILKHAGQAVTNLARVPVRLIAGESEKTDAALDWVLLVPLEFASNALAMKGIVNTTDYETAFADKGVIGSMLEFAGSTFIVYRVVDKVVDEIKGDSSSSKSSGDGSSPEPPQPEPPVTPPDVPGPIFPSDWGVFIWSDGQAWTGTFSG